MGNGDHKSGIALGYLKEDLDSDLSPEKIRGLVSIMLTSEYIRSAGQIKSGGQSVDKFAITPLGRDVVKAYFAVIEQTDIQGTQFFSHELTDAKGNLTPFGAYAIQLSEELADFIRTMNERQMEAPKTLDEVLVGSN